MSNKLSEHPFLLSEVLQKEGILDKLLDHHLFAVIHRNDIGILEGKILTIVDASVADKQQNKALKDIIRRAIWFDWAENLIKTSPQSCDSMPELKKK